MNYLFTDIMNNKDGRYTKVLNDLTSKATGLKELVLSYPFNEYKKDVKDSAKITVEDYNSKILKQYEELNKRKDITVKSIKHGTYLLKSILHSKTFYQKILNLNLK